MSSAYSLETASVADHDPSQLVGPIVGGGLLTVLGGVVGAVLQAFRKPSAPAEMIAAATAAAEAVIQRYERQTAGLEAKVEQLTLKIEKLDAEHSTCREELARSRADREELGRKIDDLMRDRVARPGEPDLFP